MSDAPDTPRWDLLPHDAEGFFGLEPGYDRKDLKRSYNQLLRRFKPERHPAEFQKIRAAYEQLDNRLRYGQSADARVAREAYRWEGPEISAGQGGGAVDGAAGLQSPALHELLEQRSPQSIYEELKSRDGKRPYDYFALALIGDSLADGDSLVFAKWLLTGLREHPGDPGLLQMLFELFRTLTNAEEIPKLLLATSKVVRDDRFYFLTEPLWDRLLRVAPFAEFRRTLTACESKLRDHRIAGRLIFYVHILKPALCCADEDWLAAGFDFLEEHHREIGPIVGFDLEILFALREYWQHRDQFLNGHFLRAEMDRVVDDYCWKDDIEAERSFLEFQVRLASEEEDVLGAFPPGHKENYEPVFHAWSFMDAEIADRLGIVVDDRLYQRKFKSIRSFLRTMETKTERSFSGQFWNWCGWAYMLARGLTYAGAFVVTLIGLLALAKVILPNNVGFAVIYITAAAIVAAAAIGYVSNRYVLTWLWRSFCMRMSRRCYRRIWRTAMLKYMRQTHVQFGPLREMLHASMTDELPTATWMLVHSGNDFGLLLYSASLRYLA